MEEEISTIEALPDRIAETGVELLADCEGSIFPCDALALAAIARAIGLTHGFLVLVNADNYECAAGLLRFQLDNVLRLFGVTTCGDPHDVAIRIIEGKQLNRIKHDSGKPMTDAHLVELLGRQNAWLADAYTTLSGFVHLSTTHFHHLLARSTRQESGIRDFVVSHGSAHISDEQKTRLIRMFAAVTRGLASLVTEWTGKRRKFGTKDQLASRFNSPI